MQYMTNSFSLNDLKPPITKRKLASALEVSERSIFNYQLIAITYIDDFLPDYPNVVGRYETAAPMTYYQAWCIWKIKQFLDYCPMSSILKNSLENDQKIQQSWSKAAFMAQFPAYSDNSPQSSLIKL